MSIILAKVFGLYFLAIGLAFIFTPQRFKHICQQTMRDENFLFLGGILALLIGAVVISIHNHWSLDWTLIITLLGWWSLIKGFSLLIYPNFIKFFSFLENRSNVFYQVISLVYILVGLFLLYKSW